MCFATEQVTPCLEDAATKDQTTRDTAASSARFKNHEHRGDVIPFVGVTHVSRLSLWTFVQWPLAH